MPVSATAHQATQALVGESQRSSGCGSREVRPGTDVSGNADGALIELSHVSREYVLGSGTVTALRDVSLHAAGDELVVVLGPSGSGKTTLLNLMGALDTPTAGLVVVAGHDLTRASRAELTRFRRHAVSFIFQTFNLFPGLTALENVQFGVDVSGSGDAHDRAAEILQRVGLGDRLRHFPHELSGGEQQRVAIARALATANPIVLADEPTGELDFVTGVEILTLLREQVGQRRAVVVVTHNREIARAADRVIELSGGSVVSDGPPPGGRVAVDELRW